MNKKVKALVGSALAIAMSVSVATGATFALFTDKAEVNVAITAGKVDVEASLDNVRLYSMGVPQGGTEFENLGYANLDTTNNILTLTNITPGDKVEFDVNLSSLSNVKTKVRTIVEDVSENQELMSGLVVKVNGVETAVADSSATSGWVTADPTAGYNETMTISIELPEGAGNEYQEKSAKLRIAIEAVQWNAPEINSAQAISDAIANGEEYIMLTDDITDAGIVFPEGGDPVTINLNGHSINFVSGVGSTGTKTLGMQILKGNSVTLMNGTLAVPAEYAENIGMLINNYGDLTLKNMVLDGANVNRPSASYALSINSGNVVIEDTVIKANSSRTDAHAMDVCQYSTYTPPTVTIKGDSKIYGDIETEYIGNATFVIEGGSFTDMTTANEFKADGATITELN